MVRTSGPYAWKTEDSKSVQVCGERKKGQRQAFDKLARRSQKSVRREVNGAERCEIDVHKYREDKNHCEWYRRRTVAQVSLKAVKVQYIRKYMSEFNKNSNIASLYAYSSCS